MSQEYDTLIRNALVFDGQGSPPEQVDVAIEAGKIAAIGSLDAAVAKEEMSVDGLALCPGFIDVHTHDDFAALSHPDMGFKSRGGVTTCIVGNCGFGAAPFAEAVDMLGRLTPGLSFPTYEGHAGNAKTLADNPPGVNIGVLAGHGTLRKAAVGSEDREPTGKEMNAMKAHLNEAMDAGVLGMSSGLIYDPGRYARTEELIEVASLMRGTGALYATHMRDEGEGLLDSVAEAIEIGARAGVGVQISHHKANGRESWGLIEQSLQLIEVAQGRGEDVHADQYPYTAGSTALQAILENGAFGATGVSGGIASASPDDVVVASCPGQSQWEGKSVSELAQILNLSPLAAAREVVVQSPGTSVILHMMCEEDVQRVMRHPSTMIGSDGIPTLDGRPHPRLYNSFARVLGHYSRDVGLFDLATAIYRMSGFSAKKFGLAGSGEIAEGAWADLVLFDPDTVIDKGTFEDPNQYPAGLHTIFVNGQIAVQDDKVTGHRAGQVLTRAS